MATGGIFAKSPGDIIYLADYNSVQGLIYSVKKEFYGVATVSSQLPADSIVTSADWNNLKVDIDNCIKHQTGSNAIPEITAKAAGMLIQSSQTNLYNQHSNSANTNKIDVYAPTQLALVANTAVSNRNGSVNPWNTTIQHTVRVNFASADAATYFFNCGGYLTTNVASTGGSSSKKDIDWAAIIALFGTRAYTRTNWLAGGTVILEKAGLANEYTPVPAYSSYVYSGYTGYTSYLPYAHSYIRATATKDSSSQITITILFNDAGPDGYVDESITLNITSSLNYYKSVDAIVSPVPLTITNIETL